VGYIVLPHDTDQTGFHLADWSEEELEEADERAREAIRTLRSGHFVFDPERSRRSGLTRDPFRPLLWAGWYADESDATDADASEAEGLAS
jgi:hypothetical protein